MVILPYWEQRHPDHRVTCKVGYDACFYAGLSKAKLSGEPHRPRKIIYSTYYATNAPAQFAVDISEHFERKLESIRCYRSQFPVDGAPNRIFIPGVDVFEYVRLRDRELGIRIRVEYAEGYVQKDLLAVDDPMQLDGVSI
jgi:LmbE family N-acetylglucosaminyl deacetylase